MVTEVRIFQPAKSAMQSGRANTERWVLEMEPQDAVLPDSLMGWSGSSDTYNQVRLRFDTLEQATAYAKNKGYAYMISQPQQRKIVHKSYAQNFAYQRHAPWTH